MPWNDQLLLISLVYYKIPSNERYHRVNKCFPINWFDINPVQAEFIKVSRVGLILFVSTAEDIL